MSDDTSKPSSDAGAEGQPRDTVGPDTDALKSKFRSQSIPLEQDFADLIDMADIGRRALGKNPSQDGIVGAGLQTGSAGKVFIKASAPFIVDTENGLSIKLGYELDVGKSRDLILKYSGTDSGLGSTSDRGVFVNAGAGLNIGSSNKLNVNIGMGLESGSDGALSLKVSDPLKVTKNGLELTIGQELAISSATGHLTVRNESGSGLSSSKDMGLFINAGDGLKISGNKLVADRDALFTKGMIMMFSGSTVPSGWALCDGKNGTPNLIDRFVLGGSLADSGTASSTSFSGSGASKSYSAKTSAVAPAVTVTVEGTALSLSQLPEHHHQTGKYLGSTLPLWAGTTTGTSNPLSSNDYAFSNWSQIRGAETSQGYFAVLSQNEGASQSHSHDGKASQTSHDHNVILNPPYYILAFIMKL